VPKIESFTLGTGVSNRLHDIVQRPYRFGRRGAPEGVFGSYFTGVLPSIRISVILHVAVLFTFLDGVGFQEETNSPAVQGSVGLPNGGRLLCLKLCSASHGMECASGLQHLDHCCSGGAVKLSDSLFHSIRHLAELFYFCSHCRHERPPRIVANAEPQADGNACARAGADDGLPDGSISGSSSGGCPKCRANYCGSNAYGVSGSWKFRRWTRSSFVARTRFGKMSPNVCSITAAGGARDVMNRMAVGRTSSCEGAKFLPRTSPNTGVGHAARASGWLGPTCVVPKPTSEARAHK
jgi:hypothetical protein